MPPRKAINLSSLVDQMSEDEFANTKGDVMLTSDSATESRQPTKKRANSRVVRSAARVTKAKAPSRRTSGGSLLTATKNKGKKKALAERSDVIEVDGDGAERMDTLDDQTKSATTGDGTTIVAAKPARKRQTKPKTVTVAQKAPTKAERARAPIPQTQLDPMQIEQTVPEDDDSTSRATVKPQAPAVSRSRPLSRQPEPPVGANRYRAGSASSTERANDPGLRRKLGDITKKFENLDLKYHNLKEVALTEAHSNFEKLRKTTDKRAQGSQVPFTFIPCIKLLICACRSRRYHSFPQKRTRNPKIACCRSKSSPLATFPSTNRECQAHSRKQDSFKYTSRLANGDQVSDYETLRRSKHFCR